MKAERLALGIALGAGLWLCTGCGQSRSLQNAPTPLPVVADLSGVKVEGRLEPVRFAELAPAVEGLVSEVLVSEGEQVEAGQLIVRLDSTNAETLAGARTKAAVELGQAHEAVRVAEGALDDYPLPRVFEGLKAEEAARLWLKELDAAREAFAPYKNTSRKTLKPRNAFSNFVYPSLPHRVLFDTGEYDEEAMVYKKRLDVAWMNYTKAVQWLNLDAALETAQAQVADAQRRYDNLNDSTPPGITAGARSALATAEIRAPFAGTVTKVDLKVGELVSAGVPVVTVADLSSWIVKTTDLTEIDVVQIRAGMPASITFDSMPDVVFSGRVATVDLSYGDREGDILYPADVVLAEQNPQLRWGMTAEVTFGE